MKKDKKFLLELEQQLNSISKKKRNAIVLKYRNIIDEKINEKKKIKDILKEIGTPEEIAQRETNELKKSKKINITGLTDNVKQIGSKTKNGIKKLYNGITKDIQIKPKDKKEKIDTKKEKITKKEVITSKELKEIKIKPKKITKKELNKKIDEEDNLIKERIKKYIKTNEEEKISKKENNIKENKKIEEVLSEEIIEKKSKKTSFDKLAEKFRKNKIEETVDEIEIEPIKEEIVEENIEIETKIDKNKKIKDKTEEPEENVFDIESDNQIEEICEITEIISDTPKNLSKKEKTRKIIFELSGIIVITVMLFIWMWISVIFLASLFAYLDGIKLYGLSISFLGLDVLFFWIIIMINRWMFKKKNVYKTNLIIVLSSIFVIAIGIALFISQLSNIEHESDVTLKYSMTTKYDTYKLPSKEEEKMYIFFNSNYDTQYMIKYDNNLDGKFKLEVKYYENYYDYNVKKSSNNLYVSLSVDTRDRISSYIDDFKENKIYNKNELSRYTVKITISEKDYQRLVIEN